MKDISIRGKFGTQNPAILILKIFMLQNLSGNTGIEITTGDRWKSVAIDKTGEGSKVFSIEKKKKPFEINTKGKKNIYLESLNSSVIKSSFTINTTWQKTENCLNFTSGRRRRAIFKNYSMFYYEIKSNVLQSSNETAWLSYQSDHTLTFQVFCWPLPNSKILTLIIQKQ